MTFIEQNVFTVVSKYQYIHNSYLIFYIYFKFMYVFVYMYIYVQVCNQINLLLCEE